MSETYNRIVLAINDKIRAASQPLRDEVARYQKMIADAEVIVSTLVKNPVQAVMAGTSMDDIRANELLVNNAYRDAEVFAEIVDILNADIQVAEKLLIAQRSRIDQAVRSIPVQKQNLLRLEAEGRVTGEHLRHINSNINSLILQLDKLDIPFDDIKTLKEELLYVAPSVMEQLQQGE